MAATRYKLDNDTVSERFLEGARLIGLVAPVKDYQLCWQINRSLQFDFRLEQGLEIRLKTGRKSCYFNVFEYEESIKTVIHYLFNNHYKADFLLPELRHLDYLWLIKGEYYQPGELKLLLDQVREIECIQLVAEFSLNDIKNKQNLTLD